MLASSSIDRIVFQSELVTVGAFRCPPDHPSFQDTGPIRQHCFVFPRSAVTIEHEHLRPFVANPNSIALYNRGQRYLRGAISRDGDRCDWFGVDGELARDVLRPFDPTVDERPDEPFQVPHALSDAALYLLQRQVFELADSNPPVEALEIEERVVSLLERVVSRSFATSPRSFRRRPRRDRGERMHEVERLLSERWNENLKLTDLAREVGLSVYHLCRSFRLETGTTIHQYRHQLRMRASLEPLRQTDRSLVEIALGLGFSSHSHFTNAFHREFGVPPSMSRSDRSDSRSALGA